MKQLPRWAIGPWNHRVEEIHRLEKDSSTDSSSHDQGGTERYVLVRGPLDSDIRMGFNDAVTPLVEMNFGRRSVFTVGTI